MRLLTHVFLPESGALRPKQFIIVRDEIYLSRSYVRFRYILDDSIFLSENKEN